MHKAKFGQNSPLDWRDAKIPGSADSEFKVWNQNSNSTSRESKSVTETQNNLKIQNEYFEKVVTFVHFPYTKRKNI